MRAQGPRAEQTTDGPPTGPPVCSSGRGGTRHRHALRPGALAVLVRQALRVAVRQEAGVPLAVVTDGDSALAEVDHLDAVRPAALAPRLVVVVAAMRCCSRARGHLRWLPHRQVVARSSSPSLTSFSNVLSPHTTPSSPAAFPGRQDSRRSCSPPALPTTVALATPSPERAAGPLSYAGHRRRTHSKSPADRPDKRRAPRGAGELGRRTRAARATVRFLCVRSAPPRRCPTAVDRLSADRAGTSERRVREPPLVMPLSDIGADQLADVGGKALNLAELLRGGFRVPPGFCLTTHAYERVADQAGAGPTARRAGGDLRRRRSHARPARRRRRRPGAGGPGPGRGRNGTSRASYRRMGPAVRGGGALVGHRRGPAVRQLRGPAGHLPRRGGRGGR